MEMRIFTFIFGIIFILLGIVSFIPEWKRLSFYLHINIWDSFLYLFSGLYGICATLLKISTCRRYFQIMGVFYLVLAILGLFYGKKEIFGILASNLFTTWFHAAIGIFSIILGWASYERN